MISKGLQRFKNEEMASKIAQIISLDERVRQALIEVDRESFVPSYLKHLAFDLGPLPLEDQFISSPLTVAKMTQCLLLDDVDSVLEIGGGSGYQAAILSVLIRRVFSIERNEKLALYAKERMRSLGIVNVNIKFGDGLNGWATYAPYDRILFSAAIDTYSLPHVLVDQLKDGGYIIAPCNNAESQAIVRIQKRSGKLVEREYFDPCLFVDIESGVKKISDL